MIPAFAALDAASLQALRDLAARWREAPERPRVAPAVLAHCDRLIGDWADDPQLPLLVRKASLKGVVREHAASGRPVLHVDNRPANWALSSALLGRRPALAAIAPVLRSGAIPVAMIKLEVADERSLYRGLLRPTMDPPNLNTLGWKVCHVASVGASDRLPAATLPLPTMSVCCKSPSDHLRNRRPVVYPLLPCREPSRENPNPPSEAAALIRVHFHIEVALLTVAFRILVAVTPLQEEESCKRHPRRCRKPAGVPGAGRLSRLPSPSGLHFLAIPGDECQEYAADGDGSQDTPAGVMSRRTRGPRCGH